MVVTKAIFFGEFNFYDEILASPRVATVNIWRNGRDIKCPQSQKQLAQNETEWNLELNYTTCSNTFMDNLRLYTGQGHLDVTWRTCAKWSITQKPVGYS